MTEFEQIELLYNQFMNLTKEINSFIESEDFESAVLNLKHKNKLIKKMLLTRKTIKPTKEQLEKLNEMEETIRTNEHEILDSLKIRHKEISEELNKTKKRVKLSSAYDKTPERTEGRIIDISD